MRVGSAGEERGDYCSLRDVHLAHYFSRADVITHLVHMGLVRRTGEVVSEKEWRRTYARQQREEREREKEAHRRRLQEAEEAARRRITEKIRRKEARRTLRAALEGEWQRMCILEDAHKDPGRPPDPTHTQQEGRDPREGPGQRQSPGEDGVLHFDIVWNYRPASSTTDGAATSSGTPGASDSSLGAPLGLGRPRGPTPDKFLPRAATRGRRRVVGEPYVASLGPHPSPRYLHILRPTNNCKEVWARLCPPQPEASRLPRPTPSSPPHMRLVYAGGGAPCPTPTRLVLKQQPAGAHNVTVFQGTVCVGDEIEIHSMRRANFPFSITIYENGVSTGRLSACCEHRYAKGSRLGGRSGHLRVLEVTGGEPCLRCQLRVVEKRHKARRRVRYKKTQDVISVDSDHTEYTPPDTGSEAGSTGDTSSNNTQEGQGSEHHSSGSNSDADPPSPSSSNRLGLPGESQSPTRRRRHTSSDSCNGPSDKEVAEVLGVAVETDERHSQPMETVPGGLLSEVCGSQDLSDEGEGQLRKKTSRSQRKQQSQTSSSVDETVSCSDAGQLNTIQGAGSNHDHGTCRPERLKAMREGDSAQATDTEAPLAASYCYGSSWEEEEEENEKEGKQEEGEKEEEEEEEEEEEVIDEEEERGGDSDSEKIDKTSQPSQTRRGDTDDDSDNSGEGEDVAETASTEEEEGKAEKDEEEEEEEEEEKEEEEEEEEEEEKEEEEEEEEEEKEEEEEEEEEKEEEEEEAEEEEEDEEEEEEDTRKEGSQENSVEEELAGESDIVSLSVSEAESVKEA